MGSVTHTDAHWCGTLAASVGLYLSGRIDEKALRGYYKSFLRSPLSEGLNLPEPPAKPPERGK